MAGPSFRIAVLDCDIPVPNVHAVRGFYSDVFEDLLGDAARRTASLSQLNLQFSKYDSVLGELPTEQDLLDTDALLVTGSSASAYDQAPWIFSLTQFIQEVYTTHPEIKIFGSCFGHQLFCHALFSSPAHSVVARAPAWELGIHPISLSPAFTSHFGPVTSNPSNSAQLRLQQVHRDQVYIPVLPEGFHNIGSSVHCPLQGVWKEGRVLTLQGHAEFDRFINTETVKVFGNIVWSEEVMRLALKAVDQDDDAIWAAGVLLRFFLESTEEASLDETVEDEIMARL